jgi:hypothetical protein
MHAKRMARMRLPHCFPRAGLDPLPDMENRTNRPAVMILGGSSWVDRMEGDVALGIDLTRSSLSACHY